MASNGVARDGKWQTAEAYLPERLTLTGLREAAESCQGCPLYKRATQTVFGEGLVRSSLMLVGEQPGDQEDRQGRPFVGPAGRVLDKALEEAGIDREEAYVTNVVKHFKWVARGDRRYHKQPSVFEQRACRPWLDAEIQVLKPKVLVALGATAAKSLLGSDFRVTRQRGEWVDSGLADYVTATVHPSSILRQKTDRDRERAMRAFVEDFREVAKKLNGQSET
jgi:uracil-DNA glycosylase family protein